MNLYDSLLEKFSGHPYSNYFMALCPFHQDRTPSLFVYEDGTFRCAACGKKGKHKFLDQYTGSHFRSVTMTQSQSRVLPRWRKWEQKYGDLDGIARHAHELLKRYPQFQTYFKRRKIHEYVDFGQFGYLDGWAVFPVYSLEQRLVDIVVRAVARKGDTRYCIAPADRLGARPLYSPDWALVQAASTVYVVYGIVDAWSVHAIGLPVVTGITGKSVSADQLKPLGKRFVIVPDLDEEREAYSLANQLGWRAKVKKISYEVGCKDPDDIRRTFGNDYLSQMIGA
jgi:DNA primase